MKKNPWRIVGWAATFAALIYVAVSGHQNRDQIAHQARLGAQTHAALCVVKHGYLNQRANSLHVIRTQPGEIVHIPGLHAGIDRSVLLRSIQQQTVQINAMRGLEC